MVAGRLPRVFRPPASIRPAITRGADAVRRQVARVDNRDVRLARGMARASRAGELDVLYLGDSTVSWVAPYDRDRRPLHRMVSDLLGPRVRLIALHGGSYNARLHSAFLRWVDPSRPAPVIILPLCVRMSTRPWWEHPVHGHGRASGFLETLDPRTETSRIRVGFPPPGQADFERFHALPHPTWAGDLRIGDYVRALKTTAAKDDDWYRLLYAYHYGGRVLDDPALAYVTKVGSQIRALDTKVVVYQTPVPTEQGEKFYGPSFRDLTAENYARLEHALDVGLDRAYPLIRNGLDHGTEEFIDWRDGSEHLNERGRLRLASLIAEAVTGQI